MRTASMLPNGAIFQAFQLCSRESVADPNHISALRVPYRNTLPVVEKRVKGVKFVDIRSYNPRIF